MYWGIVYLCILVRSDTTKAWVEYIMGDFTIELKNAFLAAIPIIHVKTSEYKRLEAAIEVAVRNEYKEIKTNTSIIERRIIRYSHLRQEFKLWTGKNWVKQSKSTPLIAKLNEKIGSNHSFQQILIYLRDGVQEPFVLLLDDMHHMFSDKQPKNGISIMHSLRDFARLKHDKVPMKMRKSIIISGKNIDTVTEIVHESTSLELPFPDKKVLSKALDYVTKLYEKDTVKGNDREIIVKAALGLTSMEAEIAFSQALVKHGKLDSDSVTTILSSKKHAIQRSGPLSYVEPRYDMSDVGGLDNLKDWLKIKQTMFGEDARARNISLPKGMLLTGVPGCGKSLVAEAIAKTWSLPLVRFDLGSVFQGQVGSSESNMRNALNVADAVSPCVLFIDEIEKGLAGSGGSGNLDSGVALRIFGTILTWMSDNESGAFVIATANNLVNLPPELKRKGRFDEVFFIDYPGHEARKNIFHIHLSRREPSSIDSIDINELASKTQNWTGAEIESAVNSAIENAFIDSNRSINMTDLIDSISRLKPQHSGLKEDIEKMRKEADRIGIRASDESADSVPDDDETGNIYSE